MARLAVDTARGDERQRLPVAVWNLCDKSLTEWGTTVKARHLRRHCSLVDEHETRRLHCGLLGLQLLPGGGNVRPVLLGRVHDFF